MLHKTNISFSGVANIEGRRNFKVIKKNYKVTRKTDKQRESIIKSWHGNNGYSGLQNIRHEFIFELENFCSVVSNHLKAFNNIVLNWCQQMIVKMQFFGPKSRKK